MPTPKKSSPVKRRFKTVQAGSVLNAHVRKVAEKRGFSETRLLTDWESIVGAEVAKLTQPIRVGYGRKGLGATLHINVLTGSAPEVQMYEGLIRERVNTCYGFNAITKLRIAGTFVQARNAHSAEKTTQKPPQMTPATKATLADVKDSGLRAALGQLGLTVKQRRTSAGEKS